MLENGIKRDAGYLIITPAISKWRPLFLNADNFSHVLIGRVSGHKIIIWQLILLYDALGKNTDMLVLTSNIDIIRHLKIYTVYMKRYSLTSRDASSGHFPDDEAKTVHVSHYKRLEVASVQGLIQHFWWHVALRANS